MSNSLKQQARELAEHLHHLLCAAQNLPWEEGDCCEDCEENVKKFEPMLTRVQEEARLAALEEAAAYVDDWHSEVDSPFAGDCIRAHFALAQAAPPALKGTKCSCIEQVRTAASMQPDAAVRRIILAIADGLEAAAPATKEG